MDWRAWAARATAALDIAAGATLADWQAVFAEGGTYADPVNPPTADLAAIFELTRATFPDYRMTVTSAAGDDRQGVMEWVSEGTLPTGQRVQLHGCSVVGLDECGAVVRWRDYFDMGEFDRQARPAT